jgi:putative ABC transport system substrate-binding protein
LADQVVCERVPAASYFSGITAQSLRETKLAAGVFGVKLQYQDVLGPKDIETLFQEARKGRVDAVLVLESPVFLSHRKQIADLAVKSQLPVIYRQSDYMDAGCLSCLMFYGANSFDLYRRAAMYVDKILKGANPAELPVEQPMKFGFIINLKTAKQIGVTIPPNVLARADKVIR